MWSVDVCCEGRRFQHLQVESYALRIVIESGSVNLTAYNLESDWLNLNGTQSIPGVDSDLQHRVATRHSASHQPREAPCPRQGSRQFRPRQTAHTSRISWTATPGEDCDVLQMAEVPSASSVRERSPRHYVLDQPTQPHAPPTCHDWRLFRAHQPRPATLSSPQPALTSTDAPSHLCEVAGRRRTDLGKVANRDTSPQKRQACADGEAFASPVASRT